MTTIVLSIVGLSILLQVAAAGVALGSIRKTGSAPAWIGLATALTLMSARRLITLVNALVSIQGIRIDPVAESVALVISVLMLGSVVGLKSLVRRIHTNGLQLEADLDARNTLLREVHHRIKNHMATVSSLLALHAQRCSNDAAFSGLDEARTRVDSMMTLYDELYRSSRYRGVALKEYFGHLVVRLFETIMVDRNRITLITDIEDIELSPVQAQPLGMVINELMTNSLKHAFGDGRKGTINVAIERVTGDRLVLSVTDNGIGETTPVSPAPDRGFGLELVAHLAEQLGGKAETKIGNGRTTRIEFPITHGVASR